MIDIQEYKQSKEAAAEIHQMAKEMYATFLKNKEELENASKEELLERLLKAQHSIMVASYIMKISSEALDEIAIDLDAEIPEWFRIRNSNDGEVSLTCKYIAHLTAENEAHSDFYNQVRKILKHLHKSSDVKYMQIKELFENN